MPKRIHKLIKSHHGALKMLGKSKGINYRMLIKNTPKIVHAVQILFKYILGGQLQLKAKHVKRLTKHKAIIRKVAHSPIKSATTHVQKGGSIISSILNTVLPLLPALLL